MDDDFNTPKRWRCCSILPAANRGDTAAAQRLRALAATLGLLQRDATHS